jgi:SAM-dependent methyltransferase
MPLGPIQDVTGLITRYVAESDEPDMREYGRDVTDDFERFMLIMRRECRSLRLGTGSRVLDIGCGYGWQALAIHAISGAEVDANDVRRLMTDTIDRSLERVGVAGVRTLLGDVCGLNLPEASYDAVICHQTLEHVHDEDRTLDVIARSLKPGGRYLITNDNNALSKKAVRANTAMWERRDGDWALIEEFRRKRPSEGAGDEPFAVTRARIVKLSAPHLSSDELEAIVAATAGLRRPQIEEVARDYRPGARLPTRPPYSWCRNPETGEYCERLIDPFEVAAKLRQRGLRARVEHGFTRWPLSMLNGVGIAAVNNALFQVRPYFRLVGSRRAGSAARVGAV